MRSRFGFSKVVGTLGFVRPGEDSEDTQTDDGSHESRCSSFIWSEIMKVWELIAKLSACPAGANVNIGIAQTLNIECDEFECSAGEVSIRASSDVEVAKNDGETVWLSSLCADE